MGERSKAQQGEVLASPHYRGVELIDASETTQDRHPVESGDDAVDGSSNGSRVLSNRGLLLRAHD